MVNGGRSYMRVALYTLANEEQIDIADLKLEQIISMNEKCHVYHDVINACHLNGFNPNIVAKLVVMDISESY